MSTRAVSPVVSFTILVGITAVVAVSILVASGAILGDVESTAETQQVGDSMVEFAGTADRLAVGETDQSTFHAAGDRTESTAVNESAGHVEVTLVRSNGSTKTLLAEDLGAYHHELEDGTEVAYQGGGVWRHTNGVTKLVSPPSLQYRDRTEPTLLFSLVRLTGNPNDVPDGQGSLGVVDREEVFPGDSKNPIQGTNLYVDIESRYCDGWERYVDERTQGTVAEGCAESNETSGPNELRMNMSVPREESQFLHEGVGLYSEGNLTASDATVELNTTIATGGEVDIAGSTTFTHDGKMAQGVGTLREPNDDEISDLVDSADPGDWETLCDSASGSCTYEGNQTIYVDTFDGGSSSATFDLAKGDVTLVVDDDFHMNDSTAWDLENHDGHKSVEIYVTGNATFEGYTTIGPDGGPGSLEATSDPPDSTYAEGFQFYLGSDASIKFADTVQIEATFSAPSTGTGNTSSTSALGSSASVNLIGSLYVGDVDLTDLDIDLYQPTHLGAGDVSEMEAFGAIQPDLYYLHLSKVTLEVDD